MDPMLFYETEDALRTCGYRFLAHGYLGEDGDFFDLPKNDYDLYEIQHHLGMTTEGRWPEGDETE